MTAMADKYFKVDCGSGKISSGEDAIPFFMRPDGEAIIARRQKELETFLKCLESYPLNTILLKDKTLMFFNPNEKQPEGWWNSRTTKEALLDFLLNSANHKVDGKIWNNGFLGSRWADTILNGHGVRIAFYTRKGDPKILPWAQKHYDYALMVSMLAQHKGAAQRAGEALFEETDYKEEYGDDETDDEEEEEEEEKDKSCCLCSGFLDDEFGNNPAPLASEGRCCGKCNALKVIPARMAQCSVKPVVGTANATADAVSRGSKENYATPSSPEDDCEGETIVYKPVFKTKKD